MKDKMNYIYIGLALVVIFAIYKILKGVGLIADTEAVKAEEEFSSTSKFEPYKILFNVDAYKSKLAGKDKDAFLHNILAPAITNPDKYKGKITKILGAKKFINDVESQVFEVFKGIGSIDELAVFAKLWTKYVNDNKNEIRLYYLESPSEIQNVGDYLNSFLNGADFVKLKGILAKLKPYKA